jgi:hypothetical protein
MADASMENLAAVADAPPIIDGALKAHRRSWHQLRSAARPPRQIDGLSDQIEPHR